MKTLSLLRTVAGRLMPHVGVERANTQKMGQARKCAGSIAFWMTLAAVLGHGGSAFANPSRPIGTMTYRITDAVAACIVERQPELVRAWLSTLPGLNAEKDVVRRREADFPVCFRTVLSSMLDWEPVYDYPAMRAVLLRLIVARGAVQVPIDPPAALAQPRWYDGVPKSEGERVSAVANDLGFCLARSDWRPARNIVLSEDGGDVTPFIARIAGCVPLGTRLTLDRQRLRDIFVETVYHASGGVTASALVRFASTAGKTR